MSVLAIVPARSGSKGIPGKNFRPLAGGPSCVERAILCAREAGLEPWISTDRAFIPTQDMGLWAGVQPILRPAELAQDDTPMIDVVTHALAAIPGPEDQIILLLQPTQPLRQPKHLQQAIALLRETQADSVVSVVELPKTHHPLWVCEIDEQGERGLAGELYPWPGKGDVEGDWFDRPTRRQDLSRIYKPDGTVYAFTREAFERCDSIFGSTVRPLIIPPNESCELDTLADWEVLERRLGQ